jgi:hypothetical protein
MDVEDAGHGGARLEDLIADVATCSRGERINLREPVLAFGGACIRPVAELAARDDDLTATAAAWLEELAKRDTETKAAVVRVLAVLARNRDGHYAQAALDRLGVVPRTTAPKAARTGVRGPSAVEAAVHARIIQAAREGRILTYGELETNRRYVGQYLHNISLAEAEQGHPPITAIVVGKAGGQPGPGFLPAMEEISYAHRGESLEPVWMRAVAEVHAFWRQQAADDAPPPTA